MSDALTRICGQPSSDGSTFCESRTITSWFDGYGWRCRHHIPEGMAWPHERRTRMPAGDETPPPRPDATPLPNEGRITSIQAALDAIAWATENLMSGALTESMARGVINGARQYMRGIATTAGADVLTDLEQQAAKYGALKNPK